MRKFGGSVANIYLGKVTEAFKKIPSSFGAVDRKPGLGVNYPPPTCNTRVNSDFGRICYWFWDIDAFFSKIACFPH